MWTPSLLDADAYRIDAEAKKERDSRLFPGTAKHPAIRKDAMSHLTGYH
jgi:hypothetical protein